MSPNKDLISRTIALHVCYKSLYISLLSSAKQQHEMTKFWVFWTMCTSKAKISYFSLKMLSLNLWPEPGFKAFKATGTLNTSKLLWDSQTKIHFYQTLSSALPLQLLKLPLAFVAFVIVTGMFLFQQKLFLPPAKTIFGCCFKKWGNVKTAWLHYSRLFWVFFSLEQNGWNTCHVFWKYQNSVSIQQLFRFIPFILIPE